MIVVIASVALVVAVIAASVVVSRRRTPNAPRKTGQQIDAAYVAAADISRHNDDVGSIHRRRSERP